MVINEDMRNLVSHLYTLFYFDWGNEIDEWNCELVNVNGMVNHTIHKG